MTDQPQDYFKSEEHSRRVKVAIEREHARLIQIGQADGAFASISDAIGTLTTHTSWFAMIGLRETAAGLLEAELERLKKL